MRYHVVRMNNICRRMLNTLYTDKSDKYTREKRKNNQDCDLFLRMAIKNGNFFLMKGCIVGMHCQAVKSAQRNSNSVLEVQKGRGDFLSCMVDL